jgi:hypothetical protein
VSSIFAPDSTQVMVPAKLAGLRESDSGACGAPALYLLLTFKATKMLT